MWRPGVAVAVIAVLGPQRFRGAAAPLSEAMGRGVNWLIPCVDRPRGRIAQRQLIRGLLPCDGIAIGTLPRWKPCNSGLLCPFSCAELAVVAALAATADIRGAIGSFGAGSLRDRQRLP